MSNPRAVSVVGPLFVTERSALAKTVVGAVELLLPGLLSVVVLVTFAVFESTVPFGVALLTPATTLKAAEAPLTSVPIEQLTVAPVVQLKVGPLVWFSETNVVPAGSVSVHVTVWASEGPLFATVIV